MRAKNKLLLTLAAVFTASMVASNAAEPTVGDDAPNFKLPGSDGKTYELSAYKGKQAVVVSWFPKAFTGG